MGQTCSAGPQTRAIVITNDYKKTDEPLNCSVDGENFAKLASACGCADLVIQKDSSRDAAITAIEEMAMRAGPGDSFVLFFAGHGAGVEDEDGDEEDGQDEALVFTGETGQMDSDQFMTDDELAELITGNFDPSVKILIITDCCHSGTIGDLDKECWLPFNARAMAACQDYETATDTGKGGVLTGLICETLETMAETKDVTGLTVNSLFNEMNKQLTTNEAYAEINAQQLSLTKTKMGIEKGMAWPFCPKKGYNVAMFDGADGANLIDSSQFVQRDVSPEDFKSAMIHWHNVARALHGAGPVEWDDECEEYATMCAQENASDDCLSHVHCGPGDSHGQNIAMYMDSRGFLSDAHTAQCALSMWYDEFNSPGYSGLGSSGCGHFTQVVWKESNKIGAAFAKSDSGCMYICCNYTPGGNMNMGTENESNNVDGNCNGDNSEVCKNDASSHYDSMKGGGGGGGGGGGYEYTSSGYEYY